MKIWDSGIFQDRRKTGCQFFEYPTPPAEIPKHGTSWHAASNSTETFLRAPIPQNHQGLDTHERKTHNRERYTAFPKLTEPRNAGWGGSIKMAGFNRGSNRQSPFLSASVNGVTATVGAETGGNTRVVAVQLKDGNEDVVGQHGVFMYLSDDIAGNSIAASAPSGGWAIGTDGLLIPHVTNKAATFISEADGDIDISIVEATAKTFYVMAIIDGKVTLVATVTFA